MSLQVQAKYYCLAVSLLESAGPSKGSLLSVTVGKTTSIQMGLESMTLKKLHSFLVTAEAACSSGDFPVVAVDARLAAVLGLATTAVPTVLAAAEPLLLKNASGAAQAVNKKNAQIKLNQRPTVHCRPGYLFALTGNIKYSGSPSAIWDGLKHAVRSFLIDDHFAFASVSSKYLEFNRTIFASTAIILI